MTVIKKVPVIKKEKQTMLKLKSITAKTNNQKKVFQEYDKGNNLLIYGTAGTGKTFLSVFLGLDSILNEKNYKQLVICRSCVPAREQGFLPGSQTEKDAPYEAPYEDICHKLFPQAEKNGVYQFLKNEGYIKFLSTSYLRGITLDDSVVLIEEFQNMNFGEFNSIITRLGDNCRLLISGDTGQDDLQYLRGEQESCFNRVTDIISRMESFSTIEMGIDDIVRGGVVREWIIKSMEADGYSLKRILK